jgi:hypothetical protein
MTALAALLMLGYFAAALRAPAAFDFPRKAGAGTRAHDDFFLSTKGYPFHG